MLSHYSLRNSGKSFFNISMTLALERGFWLHYRHCTSFCWWTVVRWSVYCT